MCLAACHVSHVVFSGWTKLELFQIQLEITEEEESSQKVSIPLATEVNHIHIFPLYIKMLVRKYKQFFLISYIIFIVFFHNYFTRIILCMIYNHCRSS